MNPLDELETEVTDTEGAADSIITLLTGYAAYLESHATDPARVRELAGRMRTKKQAIVDAVLAHPLPTDPPPADPANPSTRRG